MPDIPGNPKFKAWQQQHDALPTADVIRMYEDGFAGCEFDPAKVEEAREKFRQEITDSGGIASGAEVAHTYGWAGSGAGKLCIAPVLCARICYGECLPGPGQERGDCVSHDQKNACLATVVCEVVAGNPDETSGRVEGAPVVPPEGIKNGVFSSEWSYWHRGYNGDGWSCSTACRVTLKHGMMIRKKYEGVDLDLSDYSGKLAGRFGSKAPPEEFEKIGREHLIRTATELNSFDEVRDFIHNGYGVSSCGGEGFSSTRDENGVSKRSGSWSHAMSIWGADDRDEIKAKYNGPLVLVQNSWGVFNGGPRRILGTSVDIFEGSFWARWSDVSRRELTAMSGANGWPAQKLPAIDLIVG